MEEFTFGNPSIEAIDEGNFLKDVSCDFYKNFLFPWGPSRVSNYSNSIYIFIHESDQFYVERKYFGNFIKLRIA